MPYLKVSVNGRRYSISGITGTTTSKHILCSLARLDSMVCLADSSGLSDSILEIPERGKGVLVGNEVLEDRSSRSRRRTRSSSMEVLKRKSGLRVSSPENKNNRKPSAESSNEVLEWKKGLRRSLSMDHTFGEAFLTDATAGNDYWDTELRKSKPPRQGSSKIHYIDKRKEDVRLRRSKSDRPLDRSSDSSSEEREWNKRTRSPSRGDRHKVRYLESRQQQRECQDKNPEKKVRHKDSRQKDKTHKRKSKWKPDEIKTKSRESYEDISENRRKCLRDDKSKVAERKLNSARHKRGRTDFRRHSHTLDSNTSEYYGKISSLTDKIHITPKRGHKGLDESGIEGLITRTTDKRFADFHRGGEEAEGHELRNRDQVVNDTRENLLKVIESQKQCLLALEKCIKQNGSAISRYSNCLDATATELNISLERNVTETESVKPRTEETTDKANETDHDTGISEQYSDSSIDIKRPLTCDGLSIEVTEDYVVRYTPKSDDVTTNNVTDYHVARDDSTRNDVSKSDVIRSGVASYDVSKGDAKGDDVVIRHVDQSSSFFTEMDPNGRPARSANSITLGRHSDISDTASVCSTSKINEISRRDLGVEKMLTREKDKQKDLKRNIDGLRRDIQLTDKRIYEQHKLIETLTDIKKLNDEVLVNKDPISDTKSLKKEEKKIETTLKLSVKLYDYQKREMNENALKLQRVESKVRRKRWHVDSMVKELETFITSPLQPKPMRTPGLQPLHTKTQYLAGSYV